MKKILLLGNMNANAFWLASWLQKGNYEIAIFSFEKNSHWNDTKIGDTKFTYYTLNDLKTKNYLSSKFKKFLKSFDFIIGNGMSPIICYLNLVKLDIFYPYGGDIRWLTKYARISFKMGWKEFLLTPVFTFFQIRGIKKSSHIFLRKWNDIVCPKYIYKKFKTESYPIITCGPDLVNNFQKKKTHNETIQLICPTRHSWSDKRISSDKGQDILIYGIKKFIEKCPHSKFNVKFFEYGKDVDKTKKLIDELKINTYFSWIPRVPPSDVIEYISNSDLVLLEAAFSCAWNASHAQAIIMEKPFIANIDFTVADDIYPVHLNLYDEPLEVLLLKFFNNREYYQEMTIKTKKILVNKYNETITRINNLINLKN